MNKQFDISTLCVHSGYQPENGQPHTPPLVQSTTFDYKSSQEVADLFDLKTEGFFYSRLANPTVAAAEEKIASLEGGIGAIATSSGQAAISLLVQTLCQQGDNFIAASNLYGGTLNLFSHSLKRYGIEVRFVQLEDSDEEIQALIDDNTKFIYGESLGNPGVEVLDLERFAQLAHRHQLPLAVDSTFATPVLCRPFDHGADLIVHSSTKYLDGHALALGGFLVDSGNFDWANPRYPDLNQPDPSYHGLVFTEHFGPAAFLAKARTSYIRDFGMVMSPQNAWLTYLGMTTLDLRMKKHSENALAIAQYLEKHPRVQAVQYPGLESSPHYQLAKKYFPQGASGVISLVLENKDQATRFIDSLELITLAVHVADIKTMVLHPASMTHRQLSDQELQAAGIQPAQVRLSVGIESVEDIIADLDQALESL